MLLDAIDPHSGPFESTDRAVGLGGGGGCRWRFDGDRGGGGGGGVDASPSKAEEGKADPLSPVTSRWQPQDMRRNH